MKKNFEEFKSYIKDKKVAVVGIGVSNIPLIKMLIQLDAKVAGFDKKSKEDLGDTYNDLISSGAELILGEGYLDKLTGFDVVFKTPSMRPDNEYLVKARNEGAYITSEMEEFVRYCPSKIYAITGSDGKTTTTSIIYNLLKEQGFKTWVGGNIGNPLFSNIEEMKESDRVVLELSSFQLMTIHSEVEVAIVTNITPNHLDMHKDMQEYIDSKKNIFKYQQKDSLLVLNKENEITNSFVSEAKGDVKLFSSKQKLNNGAYFEDGKLYVEGNYVCDSDEIVILGMHNVENYLAAFLATSKDVSFEVMRKIATTFNGVAHRNEYIKTVDGVRYYNDSIGSSPTRTLATTSVFAKPVILIAGGYDKNLDYTPLAEEGYQKIKTLILLGATKTKIKEAFEKTISEKNLNIDIHLVDSLQDAVNLAKQISKHGDSVVLSPASASFDMFANFEIRGNKFRELVERL